MWGGMGGHGMERIDMGWDGKEWIGCDMGWGRLDQNNIK